MLRSEGGAGSILVVGILAVTLSLGALSVPLYSVLVVKRQVALAADAAALAAADVAVGRAPGAPCAVAAQVAAANGVAISDCQPDGLVITVRAETAFLGFAVWASASAGPPSAAY